MLDRMAKLTAVIVAGICAAALITVATWPPYEGGTWNLQCPPAWWQLDVLASIGLLLLAVPSYLIYLLDGYFVPGSAARSVTAVSLAVLEIALLTFGALSIARFSLRRLRREAGASS